jgi:hypothetical protein
LPENVEEVYEYSITDDAKVYNVKFLKYNENHRYTLDELKKSGRKFGVVIVEYNQRKNYFFRNQKILKEEKKCIYMELLFTTKNSEHDKNDFGD